MDHVATAVPDRPTRIGPPRPLASLAACALVLLVGCVPPSGPRSPARCIVEPDWPHPSYTEPGYIHGQNNIRCDYRVARLVVNAQLWNKRFWGWDRTGSRPTAGLNNRYSLSVVARARCKGEYDWRLTGSGESYEPERYSSPEASSSTRRIASSNGKCIWA